MKKEIKFLIIIFILIISTLIIIGFKNKAAKKGYNYNEIIENGDNEFENSILTSMNKCYQEYKENGENIEEFWQYFSFEKINRNFEIGYIMGVGSEYGISVTGVQKYNLKGEKISEFPIKYENGSLIQFESDYYQIEPQKKYMIKVYSNEDNYTYYYTIKINETGEIDLRFVCYTFGETPIDNGYEIY